MSLVGGLDLSRVVCEYVVERLPVWVLLVSSGVLDICWAYSGFWAQLVLLGG